MNVMQTLMYYLCKYACVFKDFIFRYEFNLHQHILSIKAHIISS